MGYTEENTPINAQPQEERQAPINDQPQAYYGYPPVPNTQTPPNGYPYQGFPPNFSYQATYGAPAPAPGFVLVPSQSLYHPVVQRSRDRVGSHLLTFVGAVLGFFFPLLSLLLLCIGVKLRWKHGVCIGHTIYYVAGFVCFIVAASVYSSQVTPFVCHDMKSCITDVTNGTQPNYWAPYLAPCNSTSNFLSYGDSSDSDSSDLSHGPCPLPASDDYTTIGAQSYSCASCVCERKHNDCKSAKSTSLFSWIAAPTFLILAIVARYATAYFRRRIDQELLATPYSL